MSTPRPHLLPQRPGLPAGVLGRVRADFERFARDGLPVDIEDYLRDAYRLDVAGSYAGYPLKNPWGKASGQLSLNPSQIQEAAEAGLGLVVLKTVIAQDDSGHMSMSDWAVRESRMVAERIVGKASGVPGWTISWKGRGWWQSFDAYLDLVREGAARGREAGMLVVPSVKYHLPAPGEDRWRIEEYATTTQALLGAYGAGGGGSPMPLEKDFSPTLAGSERSARRATALEWVRKVPGLIRDAAGASAVRVGLKLFNSLDDDEFQRAMLAEAHGPGRADFLIYANRLFDPDREFEGKRGIAYGGPDLSDRNLRLLSLLRVGQAEGRLTTAPLEISATGDVGSGRTAVEYALRGCTSFQIHTAFQLPPNTDVMICGNKIQKALHRLYFDPDEGLIVWALHAAARLGLADSPLVRLLDVAGIGASAHLTRPDLDG
jgi:dihydroorotate dehydrogenase